ncbi:MAG TPA: CoA-binding protein [bacterium]
MKAEEILKTKKSFAIIGATQSPERYGYEVFDILHSSGYQVFPINPKYAEIDGITCYPSLKALKQKPDVVITALAPANTEQAIAMVKELGIETIWMPPGCRSDAAVKKCQELKLDYLYDECPVGMLKLMKFKK